MDEKLVIEIQAEIGKLKTELDNAKKEIKKFAESGQKETKAVDESIKKMGDNSTKALKGFGVAIAAAGAALIALGASTQEYRAQQGQLEAAFLSAGSGAEQATATYNELYRVLGDGGQATEAATHLAKLTTNEQDLAQWTNICQGVYATFGASLPIEGLTEAANETAKVGTVTGSLADALNWAGISEDAFNESLAACNSEAEREALIRETLNGIYDEAAKNYETTNADVIAQNEAQANLDATLAKLGETMAPVITAFTNFANEALAAVTPYLADLGANVVPVLSDALSVVADTIGAILGFLTENWELVLSIAGVIGGITLAVGLYNTVAAIKAAMAAAEVTTVWGLVAAYIAHAAAVMAALAPYLLIVAAIAAIIAIIVLCVKYWDEICAAVKVAWEWMCNAVQVGVDAIVGFFTGLWDSITGGLQAAWDWIVGLVSGIATWIYETVISPVADFFVGMWDGVKNGASDAWEGIKGAFNAVADWFKNIFSKAWEGVKNVFSTGGKIFSGLKEGIANVFKTVVNGIINGINKVIKVPFDAVNKMLKKLKGISIAGVKPFGWLPTLNVPQIPQLARGGVVDSATLAVIGEQGKEMVMPLENNLQYLDKLAGLLAARMGGTGGPAKIVLQVDKKTLGEVSIDSINAITKQRGALALNII